MSCGGMLDDVFRVRATGAGVSQKRLILYPNPARSWSGPMKFLGTRLGLRKRPQPVASAHECNARMQARRTRTV